MQHSKSYNTNPIQILNQGNDIYDILIFGISIPISYTNLLILRDEVNSELTCGH